MPALGAVLALVTGLDGQPGAHAETQAETSAPAAESASQAAIGTAFSCQGRLHDD